MGQNNINKNKAILTKIKLYLQHFEQVNQRQKRLHLLAQQEKPDPRELEQLPQEELYEVICERHPNDPFILELFRRTAINES